MQELNKKASMTDYIRVLDWLRLINTFSFLKYLFVYTPYLIDFLGLLLPKHCIFNFHKEICRASIRISYIGKLPLLHLP